MTSSQDNDEGKMLKDIIPILSGSLSLTSAVVSAVVLLLGGLFFFTYFYHIGYMPLLDFKTSISLFVAVDLLGSLMIFAYFLSMLLPVVQWISCYKIERDKSQKIVDSRKDFFVSLISYFVFYVSIFTYAFNMFFGIIGILISVIINMFFSSMPLKKESKLNILKHKIIIIGYGFQSVFISLFVTFILYTLFATVDKSKQSFNNIDGLIHIFSGFSFLFLFMIIANIYIFNSWHKNKGIGVAKNIKPIAIVIFSVIFIPYLTGSANAIPYITMRNLRIGAMTNSSLVVDYKGCRILEKIDKSMLQLSPKKSKKDSQKIEDTVCIQKDKEAVYLVKNIDIQLALGDNLFLKYPSEKINCRDDVKHRREQCLVGNEKKFHLSKKNVLSYYVEGDETKTNTSQNLSWIPKR